MIVLTNEVLTARTFAEYYSGYYFFNVDTLNEMKRALMSQRIFLKNGWSLMETEKIPKEAYVVLVQFSTQEDYTQYEYRWMRILKKDLKNFQKNMEEDKE